MDAVVRSKVHGLEGRGDERVHVTQQFVGDVNDQVAALLPGGGAIVRCELVGLIPREVLESQDRGRWDQLGLSDEQTIESRLGQLA